MKNKFVIIALCINPLLQAQQRQGELSMDTRIIDLAKLSFGENKSYVKPGQKFKVDVVNKLPNGDYKVEINFTSYKIDKLVFEAPTLKGGRQGSADEQAPEDYNKTLINSINWLYLEDDELELQYGIRFLDSLIRVIKNKYGLDSNSSDPVKELKKTVESAQYLMSKTVVSLGEYTLEDEESLKIIIRRKIGNKEKSWTYIYTSIKKRGTWNTIYGFTAISTRLPFKDQTYFLRPNIIPATPPDPDRTDGYIITPEKNRKYAQLATAVFFTWVDNSKLDKNWISSWTGGLGFDLESPVIYAGRQHTYNRNLCLTYGFAFNQQKRLVGRYEPHQKVMENLTAAQLHENIYVPNFYIGLLFRFDQNPFQRQVANGGGQ